VVAVVANRGHHRRCRRRTTTAATTGDGGGGGGGCGDNGGSGQKFPCILAATADWRCDLALARTSSLAGGGPAGCAGARPVAGAAGRLVVEATGRNPRNQDKLSKRSSAGIGRPSPPQCARSTSSASSRLRPPCRTRIEAIVA